jgi:hypothetical protein
MQNDPALEALAVQSLDDSDPQVVGNGASYLGRYGSLAAEEKLWAHMTAWSQRWISTGRWSNLLKLWQARPRQIQLIYVGREQFVQRPVSANGDGKTEPVPTRVSLLVDWRHGMGRRGQRVR